MPWRGCGDGTGNSKGVLHSIFEQFVAICGRMGREGKTGKAEVIVARVKNRQDSRGGEHSVRLLATVEI